MSDKYVLDESGIPIPTDDLMEWASWFEGAGNARIVAKTMVGEVKVSTVFLALNHQYGDGPPILYETMVFGGPLNEEMERYSTREQAVAGHAEIVARVTAASTDR